MARLLRSGLIRNILAVVSGTAAAQVIGLAFSPLITRIYSPEVFGLQGVFLSFISILGPVIALRYPMAIITAETEAEALHMGRMSLQVALIMASLLFLILLAGGELVLKLVGAEGLGALVLFLPLALIFVALQEVHDYRAARLGFFRLVGIVEVVQAFMTNLARVLGGFISPIAAILVSVTTLTPAVKAVMLIAGTRGMRSTAPGCKLVERKTLLKKHREFPLYRVPTDVLSALSQSVPVMMLAALFSPAAAGLYFLARTVINLPLNVLGSALGNVMYARFAELGREGKPLFPLAAKATLFQLIVPGGGIAIAALFFPILFAFAFGEEWRVSGSYAQWMCLWIICMLTNVPTVRALPVIRRLKWHLLFNSLIFVTGAIGLYTGYRIGSNPISAVAWYSVTIAIVYAAQITTYLVLILKYDREMVSRAR